MKRIALLLVLVGCAAPQDQIPLPSQKLYDELKAEGKMYPIFVRMVDGLLPRGGAGH